MAGSVVLAWLDDTFSNRWVNLTATASRLALARLAEIGISGGAIYDGLIGMTAAAQGATLVTLDRRALTTYARVGVDLELVA